MSTTLPPVPFNVPVLDPNTNLISRAWGQWLQSIFIRIGGNIAESNDELYTVDTLRIDDGAVTAAKIAAAVAGAGLTGGAGTALAVNPDNSTLEIATDTLQVKASGIGTNQIAAGAVNFGKLATAEWTATTTTSGYYRLTSGIYVNWGVTGSIATGTNTGQTFSQAFPNACRQVVATPQGNSAAATTTTGAWGTGNYSTTGFDMYNRTSVAQTFAWIAIGY